MLLSFFTHLISTLTRPWNPDHGSLKVIETGTIQQIGNGFLLVFYRNFVPKTHRFWDIHLRKIPWPWNRVWGHWRSLKMTPFDTSLTCYRCFIVTVALCRAFPEIYNVEKYRDLEIPVKGHSNSLKVALFDRLGRGFLVVFYSNFDTKTHHFWDVRLASIQWPWNPG